MDFQIIDYCIATIPIFKTMTKDIKDYAEVKHLKLLEDYAQEQGLSWLA